jgi:LysM repeat protein
VKRLALIALLAVPAVAQEKSDLMPDTPQPQPGQGYIYPGAPLPPPPPREEPRRVAPPSAGDKGGEEKPPPPRITGRLLNGSAQPEAVEPEEPEEGVPAPQAVGGDVHVVKKGDTLWDIAREYLKNPYSWPKLWSYNPSITNPHWIYPGEIVKLGPDVAVAVVPVPTPTPTPKATPKTSYSPVTGLFLRQTGFVEPGELKAAGTIVGSKEEKLMLVTLDEAYVDFGNQRPQTGDRFTVYKPMRTVRHPVTKKVLGMIVQIFGEVEVERTGDSKLVRVKVVDCNEEMARGFRVGPLKRQFKLVEPIKSARDMTGIVVATLHPQDMVSAQTLVFVDRGKKDGIQIGNRMQIVRRGDGYQPLRQEGVPIDDKRFPRESIGEMIVVDLHDDTAAAIVTKSTKETSVGDRVEGRAGY